MSNSKSIDKLNARLDIVSSQLRLVCQALAMDLVKEESIDEFRLGEERMVVAFAIAIQEIYHSFTPKTYNNELVCKLWNAAWAAIYGGTDFATDNARVQFFEAIRESVREAEKQVIELELDFNAEHRSNA